MLGNQKNYTERPETIKKPNKPQSAPFWLSSESRCFQTSPFEKMSHRWANPELMKNKSAPSRPASRIPRFILLEMKQIKTNQSSKAEILAQSPCVTVPADGVLQMEAAGDSHAAEPCL